MFKKGFTLAEILITFGVVGIIAALTIPGLVTNANRAQIGPKLASTVSNLENGMKAMLDDLEVDSILDTGLITFGSNFSVTNTFCEKLENYMNFIEAGDHQMCGGIMKDGTTISITSFTDTYTGDKPHLKRIGFMIIDINGDSDPNLWAQDKFSFALYNDGSLKPKGSIGWDGSQSNNDTDGGSEHWKTKCPIGSPSGEGLKYCAGHIFENDLKVLYK